ncbi:golgin subfamily A member 6-like protein 7 isoform X2 [Ostrea edulis]|uniref:golgin subfamily A member 6-like protein 7 isoform X2 n=1 Tax=Ostrea edulis TaxID=37623 RepID=UPI002094D1A4|nr:golgin subfamily A member 6-like protein 7 isoform X2 [Ostrea edulis]
MASYKYHGYRDNDAPSVSRNGTPHRVSHAIHDLSQEEGQEFQEFRRSMGIVGSFTKQMVKLAVEQLKPEFERMALEAAGKALENKMVTIKEMQNELNRKEQELKRLQLEKKLLQAKFEKEKINRDLAAIVDNKEKEIRKLEADIGGLRGRLRKKAEELKKEKDRATEEESRRVEIETKFQTEIEKLKKELDRVKGQLGQIRSAKNVGDEETRKLRDRERELLQELEDIKKQQSLRFLRKKMGN